MIYDTLDKSLYKKEEVLSSSYEIDPDRLTSGQSSGIVDLKYGMIVGYRIFDATINPAGGGDFQTIKAAVDAGKTRLFLRNGSHVLKESIYLPDGVYIEGESIDGVVLSSEVDDCNLYFGNHSGQIITSGTVSLTNGSDSVTGSGTSWSGLVGYTFFLGSDSYTIVTNSSTTSITLDKTYKGATVSGQSYLISNPYSNISIRNLSFTGDNTIRFLGEYATNFLIENIRMFDTPGFTGTNSSNQGGFDVFSCTKGILNNVQCSGLSNASGLSVREQITDITISNASCSGNLYYGIYGLSTSLDFPVNFVIKNSQCLSNGFLGISSIGSTIVEGCISSYNNSGGVLVGGLGANNSSVSKCNITYNNGDGVYNGKIITDNIISFNDGAGINCRAEFAVISGNRITNNTVSGIAVNSDGDESVVADNVVLNNGVHGISLSTDAKNCTITGNISSNNTGSGIHLNGNNDRNSILSNNCQGNSVYGINISAATNDKNAIIGNICYNNTTGQINDAGTGTVLANNVTT